MSRPDFSLFGMKKMRLVPRRGVWRAGTLLAVACLTTQSGGTAHAQNTQRGAVVGGLGGAIAGALIGDHNNKAGAGAAIGGAIGAVGGAVIGNARDKEIAQQRQQQYYAQQQRTYAYQQQQLAATQAAVSIGDIVNMSRSGLSESVMITQIQSRGVQQQLQVSDIILLHQQGVPESVITAMQNARVGAPVPAPAQPTVVVQPSPVVVQEYVVPRYAPPPYYYHHHHYHRPHRHHH
jgi:outer membrane lipoprotein SlyB